VGRQILKTRESRGTNNDKTRKKNTTTNRRKTRKKKNKFLDICLAIFAKGNAFLLVKEENIP